MNRDLDAKIAKEIYDWSLISVSTDIDGENQCQVIFDPQVKPTQEHYNLLPLKGKPHKAFFVPMYSNDLKLAIKLAKHIKLPISLLEVPTDPEEIAQLCLDYWLKQKNKVK